MDGMNGHKALNLMGIIMLDINGDSWHYGDYNGSQKKGKLNYGTA